MSDPEKSIAILEQLSAMGVLVVGGRFRHRLLEHELPAPIPDRQTQDRRRVSSTKS